MDSNFSVNKRAYRKSTIEIVLSGFLSAFFFKFCILLSRLSSKKVLNWCTGENLVVNYKDNSVFVSELSV